MRGRVVFLTLLAIGIARNGDTRPHPLQQEKTIVTPANQAVYKTYFEADSRLKAPMTMKSLDTPHWQLWKTLERKIRAPIEREEAANEFDDSVIALAGKNVSVRAFMEAVAARVLARWERTEKNGYRFLVSQNELDAAYGPQSQSERERFVIGQEFIRDLSALPETEQTRLQSGKFAAFLSLPQSMQHSLSRMLENLSNEYEGKDMGSTIQPDQLPNAVFKLERKPAQGFNRLFITVKVPDVGTTGWRLNDYEEQKQAREAKQKQSRQKGEMDDIYRPVKWEISREEAKRLNALKRKIALNMRDVTFPEVLKRLHEKYSIPFVSDSMANMPQRANISLRPMPLWEALDQLTKIYRDTEWEWRKQGFLIVRAPSNPARQPSSGSISQDNTTTASQP